MSLLKVIFSYKYRSNKDCIDFKCNRRKLYCKNTNLIWQYDTLSTLIGCPFALYGQSIQGTTKWQLTFWNDHYNHGPLFSLISDLVARQLQLGEKAVIIQMFLTRNLLKKIINILCKRNINTYIVTYTIYNIYHKLHQIVFNGFTSIISLIKILSNITYNFFY